MNTEKDIFERSGNNPYTVPEGYFEDLKARLSDLPSRGKDIPRGVWLRVRPYVALAACFAASFLIGNAVLRKTASVGLSADPFYADMLYADMIPVWQPCETLFEVEEEASVATEEDIENYLIASGLSTRHLEYIETQK